MKDSVNGHSGFHTLTYSVFRILFLPELLPYYRSANYETPQQTAMILIDIHRFYSTHIMSSDIPQIILLAIEYCPYSSINFAIFFLNKFDSIVSGQKWAECYGHKKRNSSGKSACRTMASTITTIRGAVN